MLCCCYLFLMKDTLNQLLAGHAMVNMQPAYLSKTHHVPLSLSCAMGVNFFMTLHKREKS